MLQNSHEGYLSSPKNKMDSILVTALSMGDHSAPFQQSLIRKRKILVLIANDDMVKHADA